MEGGIAEGGTSRRDIVEGGTSWPVDRIVEERKEGRAKGRLVAALRAKGRLYF